jgi:hypothetical protein
MSKKHKMAGSRNWDRFNWEWQRSVGVYQLAAQHGPTLR